jgi:hypothetical protein
MGAAAASCGTKARATPAKTNADNNLSRIANPPDSEQLVLAAQAVRHPDAQDNINRAASGTMDAPLQTITS